MASSTAVDSASVTQRSNETLTILLHVWPAAWSSSGRLKVLHNLTFWRRNYFFLNFSTLCIQNVNKTGTKYVRIMKQTAF